MKFISARTIRPSRPSRPPGPRRRTARVAAGALIALGFVVAAPGAGAFALAPDTPQSRVARSIEHGHLVDDMASGRITDADIAAVARTGLDVGGRHVDNWVDRTPAQEAAAARAMGTTEARDLAASLRAAPSSSDATATTRPGGAPGSRALEEDKHWWNHIHLPSVKDRVIYLSNAEVRGIVVFGVAVVTAIACVTFDLSKLTCGILGAFLLGGSEILRTSGICHARGAYVVLPEVWRSHCG